MNTIDLQRFPTAFGELYFGGAPGIDELTKMKEGGITLFWNLAREHSNMLPIEAEYIERVLFADIPDYSIPESFEVFTWQLREVVKALRSGGKAWISCGMGKGRTGMVLACVKIALDNAGIARALKTAEVATTGPETLAQINFVGRVGKLYGKEPNQ